MSLSDNTEKLQSILQKAASLPKGEYIPVPATAKVGQTVRVTAVDDTGKPTAWEAADLNVEVGVSSWNDLTDRPVVMAGTPDTLTWDRNTEGLVCVRNGDLAAYKVSDAVPSIEDCASGATMVVSGWDGGDEAAELSAEDIVSLADGLVIIGNALAVPDAALNVEHAELEGVVFTEPGTYFIAMEGAFYVSSLTIPGYTGFAQEKIAPSHLYQPDWEQTDEAAPDFVKNKPFYEKTTVSAVILEETELVAEELDGSIAAPLDISLFPSELPETLLVTLDGVDHPLTGVDDGFGMYYAGSAPFPAVAVYFTFEIAVIALPDTEPHMVSIKAAEYELKKLDNKFIDADWTAHKERVFTEVLPDTTATISNGSHSLSVAFDIPYLYETYGFNYRVVWNGVEYIITNGTRNSYGDTGEVNGFSIGQVLDGDTYPFAMSFRADELQIYNCKEDGEVVFRIDGFVDEPVPIPEEYLPGDLIPAYTAEDEGKVLKIVNGVPTWVSIPNAEEASF